MEGTLPPPVEQTTSKPKPKRKREKSVNQCEWPDCGRTFQRPYQLTQHRLLHTGERPYVCTEPDCGQTFNKPFRLADHRARRHKPDASQHGSAIRVACDVPGCGRPVHPRQLERHRNLHHPGMSQLFGASPPQPPIPKKPRSQTCDYPGCNKVLKWGHARRHRRQVHGEREDGPILMASVTDVLQPAAPVAPLAEEPPPTRKRANYTETVCEYPGCGKVIKYGHGARHRRIHGEAFAAAHQQAPRYVEPPPPPVGPADGGRFPCADPTCTRSFLNRATMVRHHRRVHQGQPLEFPCVAPNCDKAFDTRYELARHERIVHSELD